MKCIWDAMNELLRTDLFVDLSHRGLGYAMQATHIIDLLEKTDPLRGEKKKPKTLILKEEERKHASLLEEFAKEQVAQGFPYLFTVMTTHLWSILEFLIDELVAERLKDSNNWSRPEIIHSIKGPLVEFATLSKEDQADYLTVELKRSSNSAQKFGVGQFEAMLDIVGCGGSLPEEVRRVLLELQQVRHVCAHRAGIADQKLLEVCPWITCDLDSPIRLSPSHYHAYYQAAMWYVTELAIRTADPEKKEYIQDHKNIRDNALVTLQRLGNTRWLIKDIPSNAAG